MFKNAGLVPCKKNAEQSILSNSSAICVLLWKKLHIILYSIAYILVSNSYFCHTIGVGVVKKVSSERARQYKTW